MGLLLRASDNSSEIRVDGINGSCECSVREMPKIATNERERERKEEIKICFLFAIFVLNSSAVCCGPHSEMKNTQKLCDSVNSFDSSVFVFIGTVTERFVVRVD